MINGSHVGDKLRGPGGTLTDSTVTNWLVSHGVFGKIVANHVSLDLDGVPVFTTIAINNGVTHLWCDDTVSKMGLNSFRLLSWLDILLGNSKLLDKSFVLSLDSMSVSSSLTRVHQSDNLILTHIEKLIQLVSSENLLLKWLLLWWLRHVC